MRASPRRPESSCRADRPRSIGCGEHGLAHEPHIAALLARGILVRSIGARARCVYRTARSAAPRTRCTCATSRSEADSRCCSVSRSACSVRLLGTAYEPQEAPRARLVTPSMMERRRTPRVARARPALPVDVRTASRIGRVGRVGGRRRMQTPLAASTASHGCAARSVAHDEAQREVPLRALSGGAELSRDVCGVMWITCCGETSQVPCLCGLSCLSRVQARDCTYQCTHVPEFPSSMGDGDYGQDTAGTVGARGGGGRARPAPGAGPESRDIPGRHPRRPCARRTHTSHSFVRSKSLNRKHEA